ncbi:hypothetical protein D3C71_1694740 [compost metagenome]
MNSPALVAQCGAEAVEAEVIEDAPSEAAIQIMLRLVAPGIEPPAQPSQAMLRVADEAWTAVAAPAVVHCQFDQLDVGAAQGLGALPCGRINHHFHWLEAGNRGSDTGVVLLDVGQAHVPAALPLGLIVRPDHPGCRVAGPFGGHAPAAVEGQVHS